MGLLTLQLSELKAERTILLDRLALLGLGGTLFSSQSSQDSSPATEVEKELTEEAQESQYIKSLLPSKRAAYLTRKMHRDYTRIQVGPTVKWVQKDELQVAKAMSALDQAELIGKKMA